MPDFSDAPWNKPVYEEGQQLSEEEIPSRRRKPGEEKTDPLTELIFSTVSFKDSYHAELADSQNDKTTRTVEVRVPTQTGRTKTERITSPFAPMDGVTRDVRKEKLIARLLEIEKEDQDLAERSRVQKAPRGAHETQTAVKRAPARTILPPSILTKRPSRTAPRVTRRVNTLPPVKELPEKPKAPSASRTESVRADVRKPRAVLPRAVQPPPLPATRSRIKEYYVRQEEPREARPRRPYVVMTALAAVATFGLLALLGDAAVGAPRFFSSVFEGIFGNSSFVVSESRVEEAFPPLHALYQEVLREKKEHPESTQLGELEGELLDFFERNASFTWQNIFIPKENRPSSLLVRPEEADTIATIISLKKEFEAVSGEKLLPATDELEHFSAVVRLLSLLYTHDGTYLLVSGSGAHSSPGGGEARHVTLIEVSKGVVSIVRETNAEDLNAAVQSKIVPPRSVQAVKTNLDFLEASWFMDFSVSSALMSEIAEKTLQVDIDGVIALSNEAAERLTEQTGPASQSREWVGTFFSTIAGLRGTEWDALLRILDEESAKGALQLSFEDEELSSLAKNLSLYRSPQPGGIDTLGVGIRSWEGEGVAVKLVDYRPTFFKDGTVHGETRLLLQNEGAAPVKTYVKIYVPKGSDVLASSGYSDRETIPLFDYPGQGYKESDHVRALQEREEGNLDIVREGGLEAIGGWVTIAGGGEHEIRLSYALPFTFSPHQSSSVYSLSVLSMGEAVPFHFAATYGEDMSFMWKEPLGFVTPLLAEYQKTLTETLHLSGELFYVTP